MEHIDNFPERAWEALPWQFRDAARMNALMVAMGCGVQLQENDQFDVYDGTRFEVADGDALDQWGHLYNFGRLDLPDPEYRTLMKAAGMATRVEGKRSELRKLYAFATGPVQKVRIYDHPPAGFRLTAYRSSPMSPLRRGAVRRIMERARPAGLDMTLSEAFPTPIVLSSPDSGFNSTMSRTF